MCFRENNNGGSKRPYIVLHGVNSVLHTATNTYPNAGILLKLITVFRTENLALFTVTSIHRTTPHENGHAF